MIMEHPSEAELQQFAIDESACTSLTAGHIEICEECQVTVNMYQLMVLEIRKEPRPVFDFDVSALVLSQIPNGETKILPFKFFTYFLRACLFCLFGIPIFLFWKNILTLFTQISPFFMYLIIPATLIIVSIKVLNMYKTYQKQMRILTF